MSWEAKLGSDLNSYPDLYSKSLFGFPRNGMGGKRFGRRPVWDWGGWRGYPAVPTAPQDAGMSPAAFRDSPSAQVTPFFEHLYSVSPGENFLVRLTVSEH